MSSARAKKSSAQLRRLERRASDRGEEYRPPSSTTTSEGGGESNAAEGSGGDPIVEVSQLKNDDVGGTTFDEEETKRLRSIALRVQQELVDIETNADLNAKDRRSAKRKAEAIAADEAGMPGVEELLEWYQTYGNMGNKGDDTILNNPLSETATAADPKKAQNMMAAEKLVSELAAIEENADLKSKDRRSAKRKAEAIATEATGLSPEDLLELYEKNKVDDRKTTPRVKEDAPRQLDPYIAFVGQLSYDTTKEDLMEHIRSQLGDTYKVSTGTVKIRMLTDPKNNNRFRGMAFVQVDDPEFLYALLKLHQTYLKGRRINVEKSAGGKKGSETRQQKLTQHKKEQHEYFAQVVQKILDEYKATGELRDDELDEGVMILCKRHAGPVVRAAVAEYIEKGGRDMDNPSAYLTFLVTKFATEGIHDEEETGKSKKGRTNDSNPRKRKEVPSSGTASMDTKRNSSWKNSSEFAKSGVNMSLSSVATGSGHKRNAKPATKDLANIFPSSRRGKGRGYMSNVR